MSKMNELMFRPDEKPTVEWVDFISMVIEVGLTMSLIFMTASFIFCD